MVFGLIGLLFHLVTFPGIILHSVSQSLFAAVFDAPTYEVRLRDGASEGEFAEVCSEIGLDADRLSDLDAETLMGLPEAKLAALNRVVEVSDTATFEDGETLIHYSGIDDYSKVFLLTLLPFVVSSAVCFGIFLVGLPISTALGIEALWWIVMWLGISMGAHAFPSSKATAALWNRTRHDDGVLRLVGAPFVAVYKLADVLRFLWLDAIYALGIYYLVAVVIYEGVLGMVVVPS